MMRWRVGRNDLHRETYSEDSDDEATNRTLLRKTVNPAGYLEARVAVPRLAQKPPVIGQFMYAIQF